MAEKILTDRGIPVREVIPLKAMRRMAAEHIAKSHASVAAVTSFGEVDVTEAGKIEARFVDQEGQQLALLRSEPGGSMAG